MNSSSKPPLLSLKGIRPGDREVLIGGLMGWISRVG